MRSARVISAVGWMVGLILSVNTVWATPPAPWTDTVLSARKIPESRVQATRAITVITSEELERWGAMFVSDALRHVPGVYVRRSGGIGRVTNAVIRGSGAAHVLVLVDGVQVNSPTTGAFDFAHLTTDNVDRIEILRGGASALYGSDAVGGVIHIITKDGGEIPGTGVAAATEFGTDRTSRETGEFRWSSGPSRFSTSISRIDSNGVSADDDYRNMTYSGRSITQLTDTVDLDTAVRYHEGRVGVDDGAFRPDPNRRNTEKLIIASTTLSHQVADWWQQRLQVVTNRSDFVDLDQANPGTTQTQAESRFVTKLIGGEWRHDVTWVPWGGIALGAEVESQAGDTGSFDKRVRTGSLYLSPHVTIADRLTLVSGLRWLRHNTFGRDSSWEASAAYRFGKDGPKFRAGYSQAFHAPTLNDLYFPNFSNPNLVPEESDNYEVGLDHAWGDGRFAVSTTLFHREVDQLIQFAGVAPVNIGETEQRGVELESAVQLGHGLSLEGHYTYVGAYEEPSREELLRVPHQTADLSLRYAPRERLAFDARYNFVGSREDVGRQKLGHYSTVDVGMHFQIHRFAELYARVENLFGRRYQEIIGFPSPRTAVYFGGRVRL
ncbi:MAG: TonB-dependent receptor [Candidatus Omnitrophica bacterium]|nr:TonB-dependent receptor [Candidatus Omnitrophota bacterium]